MISSYGIFDTLRILRVSEKQQRKMCELVNAYRINSNAPGYEVQNIFTAAAIKLPTIKND